MPVLSASEIASAAKQAGFGGQDIIVITAIALAESSGNTLATNGNTNGSTDFGLTQINSVHSDLLHAGDWRNPVDNMRMAKTLHDARGNFRDWSTYNSGAYLIHMAQAAAANPDIPLDPATAGATPSGAAIPQIDSSGITSFTTFFSDPHTWQRLGMFTAGTILVLIAVYKIGSRTDIGRNLKKSAEVVALL